MEIKLNQLKNIFVSYRGKTSKDFSDPPIKIEFIKSLDLRPLSSIEWIHIEYELNEGFRLNLVIKQVNSQNKWDVHNKSDEFIFPFTCKDEKDFIDIFEEHLKQELKKQELKEYYKKHPYSFPSPNYDAKISMDLE